MLRRSHELAREQGLTFIHPYDDPAVIAGQGTMALEMLEDTTELDAMILPVGGGGRVAGCAVVAAELRPEVKVFGVEVEGYQAMRQRLAGQPVSVGGPTIAEGIAVRDIGKTPLAIARALLDRVVSVDEIAIERAIALFIEVGSVALGWHYAIDGYAGAVCAWAIWRFAGVMVRITRRDEALPS